MQGGGRESLTPTPTSAWARLAALGEKLSESCSVAKVEPLGFALRLRAVGQGEARRSQALGWGTSKPRDGDRKRAGLSGLAMWGS